MARTLDSCRGDGAGDQTRPRRHLDQRKLEETMRLRLLFVLALTSCGDSAVPAAPTQGPGDDVGYNDRTDVVAIGGVTWLVPDGACIDLGGGQCLKIEDIKRERCGDPNAQADVVIVDGKVVKVICYPPKSAGTPIEQATVSKDGQTQLPQNQNGKVITFPDATNGKPVKGDIRLDGERVTLIGNGVDRTTIDGNLNVASNNAHVRGLTVLGNATFEKSSNDSSITFCKVKGNLEIHSNNVTVMSCLVFGNVQVKGNGCFVLNVGVGGALKVEGSGATCSGNYAFSDANGNFALDPAEKGAALSCGK
jgi:hypothetical protein